MDENTNLNESTNSTSTTETSGTYTTTESTTTEASFSMPTDPASTDSVEEKTSEATSSSEAAFTEKEEAATAPVTEVIDNGTYSSNYSSSDYNSSYSDNGSYPSSVSQPNNNPYGSASSQDTYSTVSSNGDFSVAFGITSLVLGILSILLFCCCGPLGLVLGICGVIFGCVQKPDPATYKKPGIAIGGIVCSSIGIVLCIITAVPMILALIGG